MDRAARIVAIMVKERTMKNKTISTGVQIGTEREPLLRAKRHETSWYLRRFISWRHARERGRDATLGLR